MSIPGYVQGFPQDGSSLGSTKAQIRKNLDGTFLTLSVDHQNQNETTPGYHDVIHQTLQGRAPAAIAGINQVFSMVPPSGIPSNGDTQLFSLTGMGGLSQMTGSGAGFFWCAGFLIQYGSVAGVHSGTKYEFNAGDTGTITFPQIFPTSCLAVISSMWFKTIFPNNAPSNNNPGIVAFNQSTFSKTSVDWLIVSLSGSYTNFYWIAIGN